MGSDPNKMKNNRLSPNHFVQNPAESIEERVNRLTAVIAKELQSIRAQVTRNIGKYVRENTVSVVNMTWQIPSRTENKKSFIRKTNGGQTRR